MRLCVIGDCGGHIGSIFDGTESPTLAGVSVSGPEESTENFLRFAASKDQTPPCFADWQEMLRTLRPDAVAVDTVFSRHAEIISFALAQGIHVYTEKPVATTLPQLEQVETALANSPAKLFAMFTARFEPWFYTAKLLNDAGEIGTPLLLHGQKSYILGNRPDFFRHKDTFGSTISWVGIHSVDQILWNTGASCTAAAACATTIGNQAHGELESAAALLLTLSHGGMATVDIDYLRPAAAGSHGDDRLRIVGTGGILEVRDNQVFLLKDGQNGKAPLSLQQPPHIFDTFRAYCQGEANPLTAGIDGIEATRACLLADAAE